MFQYTRPAGADAGATPTTMQPTPSSTIKPVPGIRRVGILGHPLRPETAAICDQVESSLKAYGVEAWQQVRWDAESVREAITQSDLVVAIGGDGAMLRAGRLCGQLDVPVFGINAGHLGFLTEISPTEWDQCLPRIITGDYWIEERLMVSAECGSRSVGVALNDVVIARGVSTKLVNLDVFIDGAWATSYNADGLIIATPTGSTAYALAVGGPILPPELNNLLVTPISPHLSLDRPLVLSEGAVVEVEVGSASQSNVMLTVDGETVLTLTEDDRVRVQASQHRSQFVRLRDKNYFYRSILDRLEPRRPNR